MIGLIVPVPKDITNSGYIRIVGDSSGNKTNCVASSWELLAVEYDIEKKKCSGEAFAVTKKEVETWIGSRPQEINIFGGPSG
jgi:hypothetical protein